MTPCRLRPEATFGSTSSKAAPPCRRAARPPFSSRARRPASPCRPSVAPEPADRAGPVSRAGRCAANPKSSTRPTERTATSFPAFRGRKKTALSRHEHNETTARGPICRGRPISGCGMTATRAAECPEMRISTAARPRSRSWCSRPGCMGWVEPQRLRSALWLGETTHSPVSLVVQPSRLPCTRDACTTNLRSAFLVG
jgi:hypothetical protein